MKEIFRFRFVILFFMVISTFFVIPFIFSIRSTDSASYGDVISIQSNPVYTANEVKIFGVPDYQQQSKWPNSCGPVSAACILGYWSSLGYPDLLGPEDTDELLIEDLINNSDYTSNEGTSVWALEDSIEIICNDPDLNNTYGFNATYIEDAQYYDFKSEIDAGRPLLHITYDHQYYDDHSFVGVGYSETESAQWCIDHDNWPTTPEDVYIEWNAFSNDIMRVMPGYADDKIVSGYIYTTNGIGIGGVTIQFSHYDYQRDIWLTDGTALTDDNGFYSSTIYYGWGGHSESAFHTGKATPLKTGFSFNPSYIGYEDVITDKINQSYTGSPPSLQIYGYIRTSDGAGISGVLMSGLPGSPTTSSSGYYSDLVPYGWTGTVAPVQSGYTFSPAFMSYIDVTSHFSDQDYTGLLVGNQPPIADAGSDREVKEGKKVELNGGGSYDPDGTIAWCRWSQISGPPVTLENATEFDASFTAPEVGPEGELLVFRFTVCDGVLQDCDEVTIEVTDEEEGGGNGGPTCAVTAAAIGSPLMEKVDILRQVRDRYLGKHMIGRVFVRLYYKYGPYAARSIEDHEVLRRWLRTGLYPIVGVSYVLIKTTVLQKMIIAILITACIIIAKINSLSKNRYLFGNAG
ncbi:MAG: C39 family peptidase [Spirochaetota bacterium]|nr:MAG: C39 family peptidase [Spirochaetota bacterium]